MRALFFLQWLGGVRLDAASRVVFSNGMLDPWSAAGVYPSGQPPPPGPYTGTQSNKHARARTVERLANGASRYLQWFLCPHVCSSCRRTGPLAQNVTNPATGETLNDVTALVSKREPCLNIYVSTSASFFLSAFCVFLFLLGSSTSCSSFSIFSPPYFNLLLVFVLTLRVLLFLRLVYVVGSGWG